MDLRVARLRVVEARIARLGTVTSEGRPHLVPCCFALHRDVAYTAVDAKPKSTFALRRVDNILARGAASLLIDHYDEDWSALWWIRLDGVGRLVDSPVETEEARQTLVDKYPQYGQVAIPGPFIAIDIETWRTWP
jgi:PPOX class probable F420-dependent enzyme